MARTAPRDRRGGGALGPGAARAGPSRPRRSPSLSALALDLPGARVSRVDGIELLGLRNPPACAGARRPPSTRSIALSGRKRSVIVGGFDSVAAATMAESVDAHAVGAAPTSPSGRAGSRPCPPRWLRHEHRLEASRQRRVLLDVLAGTSSRVVAPTQCSSPRASAGLSRFEAGPSPRRLAGAHQRVHSRR